MIVTKKGDYIYAKVEYDLRDKFRRTVMGGTWDHVSRTWVIPATISTFRNLRAFDPEGMAPSRLSPGIRAWYNELLQRARRIDELQKGLVRKGEALHRDTQEQHNGDLGKGTEPIVHRVSDVNNTVDAEGLRAGGAFDAPMGKDGNKAHSTTGIVQQQLRDLQASEHGTANDASRRVQGSLPDDVSGLECKERVLQDNRGDSDKGHSTSAENETSDKRGTVKFPDDFKFAVEPYQHQREAIAFCINLRKSALWLDMGLGKTFTSINVARYRSKYNGVKRVLVVAPRSLLHQWVGELKKYVPEEYEVYVLEGTPTKKAKLIKEASASSSFLFAITTYESLTGIKAGVKELGFDMFILDESTKIKNPKAVRSKVTVEVCKQIPYGVELTGLAYLNNPVDLFSQFLALDETVFGTDQWRFAEHYIDFVKAPFGRMMRGLRNLDELKRRAYFIAFSRRKEDCLDLPDKIYTTRSLPMYDTQKVWYDKISAEITAATLSDPELLNVGNISNVLTQLEKLQQITAGFLLLEDHSVLWLDSPKYAEICDIVQNSNEQFIIWCRHTEAMKRISDALLNRQITSETLNRYTSTHRRLQAIKQFKEGKLKVLNCQLTSESKGLDLTSKTGSVNAIYLESNFSLDDREQSESRQHRIGMKGTATYTDLVLEDTIDEHVLNVLQSKMHISEYIAKHGLDIVLGKGGSVSMRRSRSKKKVPHPDDPELQVEQLDLEGLEGFD